jgi:hypothetical protein
VDVADRRTAACRLRLYVPDVRVDFRHRHVYVRSVIVHGGTCGKLTQLRTCRNGKIGTHSMLPQFAEIVYSVVLRTFKCVPSALPPGTGEDVASRFDCDKCHVSDLDSQASVRTGHGSCHLWPHLDVPLPPLGILLPGMATPHMGQTALATTRTYTALRYVL